MKIHFILLVLILSSCQKQGHIKQARLIKAYSVETNGVLEPSGLTYWDGKFYTVSDKQDKIYQLVFDENRVKLKPIISIINNKKSKLDFEGITHDEKYFYLISEVYFQILKVSKDGKQQSWIPKDSSLKKAGKDAGLLKVPNAYLESICYLSNGKFLLTAEREPRGFIEYSTKNQSILAYQSNQSKFKTFGKRSTDFTGLSCDKSIYVLERNSYVVSKLRKKSGKYTETKGWNFQHIINQPQLLYQDMKYGHAEGLVVKGNKIYIILDNNRDSHRHNKKDSNSLFIEMKM